MANKFGKFFESLIYEDDGSTQQAEAPQQASPVQQTVVPQPTIAQTIVTSQPGSTASLAGLTIGADGKYQYTGKVREHFARLICDGITENDVQGPDYKEVRDIYSSGDLTKNIPDSDARWKTAFSMLKMMNHSLTKKYVLDAIDVYVRVIDNEMKNALAQIDGKNNDQVKEKERRIIDTENKISSSEDEIKMLQDKIAKINEKIASDKAFIETTRQEVEQAKQEIFIDKADLEVTGTMIKNNLLADKETLTRILPDD